MLPPPPSIRRLGAATWRASSRLSALRRQSPVGGCPPSRALDADGMARKLQARCAQGWQLSADGEPTVATNHTLPAAKDQEQDCLIPVASEAVVDMTSAPGKPSSRLLAFGRLMCCWVANRGGLKALLFGGSSHPALTSYSAATVIALGWPTIPLENLSGVFSNYVFQVGFVAWFIAQSGKIFTYRARKGKWRLRACLDSGGMPSSHSSLCMGVTTAVGMLHGFASSLFAMSLAFSLIVMYDAAGVRRHAGKQAEVLNMVIKDLWEGNPVSGKEIRDAVKGSSSSSASMSSADMEADRDFALRSLASGSFDDVEFLFMTEEQRLNHKKYKLERMDQFKTIATHRQDGEHPKLKEVLGHTPAQVAAGGALGVLVGLLLHPV